MVLLVACIGFLIGGLAGAAWAVVGLVVMSFIINIASLIFFE
jgi:hypothetical protein